MRHLIHGLTQTTLYIAVKFMLHLKELHLEMDVMNGEKFRHLSGPCFMRIQTSCQIAQSGTSNKSPFNTYLTSPCTSSFYFQYTNPSGILKIIQGLKPKTSAGYDHLSSKVLKDIAGIVSTPLSIIINQSLCSGIFPSKIKIAKVIPLFKKGDIQLFGNYRPIYLLSSVSKVFEKAAYGQLYEYFSSHALFYDSQYGFRKYHSTELAALELVDRIHKEIDENKIIFSVFLDLSKAFDTLDHDILLHKLQYYGITGTALDLFRSYLTERYQYVDYNGASSSMKLLTTGVPQGPILGPLLFIIYMNDIHTVSNNLNCILYADYTTLTSPVCSFTYRGYHDINRVSTLINSEITKISEWLSVNKLSLNAIKKKFVIFHNYQNVMTDSNIPHL